MFRSGLRIHQALGIALFIAIIFLSPGQSVAQTDLVNSPDAELVFQVGDADNLGFGWPAGFDVFSGESTPVHAYPWNTEPDDPAGTDVIMVGSSFSGRPPAGSDGYTGATSRPGNLPQPIVMSYNLGGINVDSAILQMFVDDFQSPTFQSKFQAKINGKRALFMEDVLNALNQGGPIGKLITLQVPSEFLADVRSGSLEIFIDDPTTGAADGFAIDFIRLLINPGDLAYTGTITGKVLDEETNQPILRAEVSASGTASSQTGAGGMFTLTKVPAGLAVVKASKSGYASKTSTVDLKSGASENIDFKLAKAKGEAPIDLGNAEVKAPDPKSLIQTAEWGEVPANQIVVVLKEGGRSDADSLASKLNGKVVGYLEYINLYQIELSGNSEVDLRGAISEAKKHQNVELAFPNQQSNLYAPLDDPVYSDGRSQGFEMIGVQEAWDQIESSGRDLSEVRIGVTDDGLYKGFNEFNGPARIDTSEPNSELKQSLGRHQYYPGGPIYDFTKVGSHGTGVMNIIAANPDNGGLVGIASEPLRDKLSVTMINIFAPPYGEISAAATPDPNNPTQIYWGGRTYVVANLVVLLKEIKSGCTILSCSWGSNKQDPMVVEAFRRFFVRIAKDDPRILFVIAAGNDREYGDSRRCSPGGLALDNMITVGNLLNDGSKCPSSTMSSPNFEVTLAAPGDQAVYGRDNLGQWQNTGGGTSMATPQVTSAAALIRALDPSLTAGQIKQILIETARTSTDVSGWDVSAPVELGGRILAIDKAVSRVIGSGPGPIKPPKDGGDDGGGLLNTLNVAITNAVYTEQDRRMYYCVARDGRISYLNRIYLTGPDLDKVASVTYILHPTFANPEVSSSDPSNSFEIWIMTWGRFEMSALIATKSGQVFEKTYDFSFRSKVEDALARGIPQVHQC